MALEPEFRSYIGDLEIWFRLRLSEEQRWVLCHLAITAHGAEVGISTSMLRGLPLTAMVASAKDSLAWRLRSFTPESVAAIEAAYPGERVEPWPDDLVRQARRRIRAAHRRELRGAARGRSDDFYRGVALDLIDLAERGAPTASGGMLQALADRQSKQMGHEVPVQTVRTWLAKARSRGFLSPGERGRIVAVAGPNLYVSPDPDPSSS